MAEVFGVIAGALSVVGLFKNCVEYFEYIRLGQSFGDDYERYQLRLDIAKLRLERWGTAIGINEDPRFRSLRPARTDKEVRLIRSLLRELKHVFEDIQNSEQRYQIKGSENQGLPRDLNTGDGIRKLRRPGHLRQWQSGFFKKTAWALYDKKRFEDMLTDMNRLLDDMETLLTQPVTGQELVLRQSGGTLEKSSISEPKGLDATDGTTAKPSTSELKKEHSAPGSVEQKGCGIEVTNDVEGMQVGEEAKAHLGNIVVAKEQITTQIRTVNKARNAVITGKARIMMGNVYGGKSFWDD
jgi:hypothetical protein